VTEEALSGAMHIPALFDPDLVVVHGPSQKIPPSLMWELGYSELVFVNTPWRKLKSADVQRAISDFTTRERRFGGIDV
jgi:undecaprenyl diphosphate synthase